MAQVACKLPTGLTITHGEKTVTLNGANSSGNRFGFGFTDVKDMDIADWLETDGKDLPAVKNGSIFIGGPDAAKERQNDRSVQTGLEPLNPSEPGIGIAPSDETKAVLEGRNTEGPAVNNAELEAAQAATKASK
jgi:hypothetical protein